MTPIVNYRKKPVIVSTMEWTGDNEADLVAWTGGNFHAYDAFPYTAEVYDELHATWIDVETGHHIIRGVKGEFYPIAPEVLADTYELQP